MSNASSNPLCKLRLPRPWEEASIIVPIPRTAGITSSPSSCVIFSLSIPLLPHVDKNQQCRCQDNNNKAFQHTLVDFEFQLVIVSIVVVVLEMRIRSRGEDIILF